MADIGIGNLMRPRTGFRPDRTGFRRPGPFEKYGGPTGAEEYAKREKEFETDPYDPSIGFNLSPFLTPPSPKIIGPHMLKAGAPEGAMTVGMPEEEAPVEAPVEAPGTAQRIADYMRSLGLPPLSLGLQMLATKKTSPGQGALERLAEAAIKTRAAGKATAAAERKFSLEEKQVDSMITKAQADMVKALGGVSDAQKKLWDTRVENAFKTAATVIGGEQGVGLGVPGETMRKRVLELALNQLQAYMTKEQFAAFLAERGMEKPPAIPLSELGGFEAK